MRLGLWALLIAGLLVAAPACGKRGPPLPPLRPSPGAPTDLSLIRRGHDVALRFTAPTANVDGSQPVRLDHFEIYALTIPAGRLPPTGAQILERKNLLATLKVDLTAPQPQVFTYVDRGVVIPPSEKVPAPPAAPAPSPSPLLDQATRYYMFQPYANSRRRGAVQTVGVPLESAVVRPDGGELKYDEQTLTLSWTLTPGTSYMVYRAGEGASDAAPALTKAPLTAAVYTQPVVFDAPACFAVRAVTGTPPMTIESEPTSPVCVTPVDTFPPPAPTGLVALASPGAINLTWDPVTAADLAGYIVLRGEGSGDRLQPLMAAPVTGSSFNDQTTKAGVRYFYAVVAVDKATPANRSQASNQVEETGR